MKKRIIQLALTVGFLVFMISLAVSASAALPAPSIRFCWSVDGREITIKVYEKKDNSLYLFLPGALKDQDPTIRLDGEPEITWGEDIYQDGSVFHAQRYLDQTVQVTTSIGRSYQIRVLQGSEIPVLFFSVDKDDLRRVTNQYNRVNKNKNADIREKADMVMLTGDGSLNAAEAVTSFKTHGNSTFFGNKKPYQFKMEHKVALAGMEKNKKWMLLANWFDISLIRNQITFDLCREIGLSSTPDCRQADLYINGNYYGTYLLAEKIQLKKGRLEISDLEETLEELNGKEVYENAKWRKGRGGEFAQSLRYYDLPEEPEDVSGGYLLEIEKALHYKLMENVAGFITDRTMRIVIKEPSHAGRRAVEYIASLVNDFHNAVMQKNGISPKTGKHYSEYIDMASFALKIAVEEFCENYDVRAASHFMYKDKDNVDSHLYAGPGWDYDLTYGNKDDGQHNPLKEDYVYLRSSEDSYLYHALLNHEDFRETTRRLFEEVFLPAAEVLAGRREPAAGSPLKPVSAYQDEIRESAAMNFALWSPRSIQDVWDGSGRTFEDSGAFVISWIDQRLDLMNEKWLLKGE